MDNKTKEQCRDLLYKYFKYKTEAGRIKYRNKLFELMLPDFEIWIERILYRWGKFESKQQAISLSWDCFEYCLSVYDTSYESFLGRFYKGTKYYLLMKFAKEDSIRIKPEELRRILSADKSPECVLFDRLLTLIQFRDVIPDKYKKIWDDSVMSLDKNPKRRKFYNDSTNIDKNFYYRAKQILIPIIKLIMDIK